MQSLAQGIARLHTTAQVQKHRGIPAGRDRVPASPRNLKRRAKAPVRIWGERGGGGLEAEPGTAVQLDTMTVKPHHGFRFKQFTAVDIGSRVLSGELYPRAIADDAALFLEVVREQFAQWVEIYTESGRTRASA